MAFTGDIMKWRQRAFWGNKLCNLVLSEIYISRIREWAHIPLKQYTHRLFWFLLYGAFDIVLYEIHVVCAVFDVLTNTNNGMWVVLKGRYYIGDHEQERSCLRNLQCLLLCHRTPALNRWKCLETKSTCESMSVKKSHSSWLSIFDALQI